MRWELAGYDDHPVPGDASRVSAAAEHLGAVAEAIREQLDRLAGLNSREIWQSDAAVAFENVVEDLPSKLELVATRYERVAGALDEFHPILADARGDAEYWIGEAETAQDEIDRAESGVERMQDFADQAQQTADDHNTANPDLPPQQPEPWTGEDYPGTLASARTSLETAVGNVQSAVSEFNEAADTAAGTIRDAANDDLENDSGLFASIRRGAQWLVENTPLHEIAAVLDVIAGITGILALALGWVPILGQVLGAIALVAAVGALLCDVVLAVAGEGSWWDVAIGAVGIATLGLGRAVGAARNAYRARAATAALSRPGALAGLSLVNANGVRYYGAAVRSRLLTGSRGYLADAPRFGFVPTARSYSQAYRPIRNVLDDVAMVRTGRNLDQAFLGTSRPAGFTNNLRLSFQEHVGTFTGAYGTNAQVLQIVNTGRSLTGLPLSLAPGGSLLSPVGSGIPSGIDALQQEGFREQAAEVGAQVPPTPITP
ncbi:MAG: putative T7SS-secreted protein [Acidimicrobiales bacterium]